MTDMEYIRMRQQEGGGGRPARGTAPEPRRAARLSALLRLTRRPGGAGPSVRMQRQP